MEERYDAVSIGSGLGGLTASALWAREGRRVLVLERGPHVGGVASGFSRGGVRFEAGLHQLDGLDPDDPKARLLRDLGVREALEFLPTGEVYAVRHPLIDGSFTLPCGEAAALEAAVRRFPGREAGIREFLETVCKIRRKVAAISRHQGETLYWLAQAPILPLRFWIVGRHERTCVGPFLDGLFGDDEAVKVALAGNILYHDADPAAVSLLFFATAQGSYLLGGSHYVRGGGQMLSEHLARVVSEHGGAIATSRRAERILVEGGRAAGVVHVDARSGGDPQIARTRVVFGNAAPSDLAAMLPEEHGPAFAARYARHPLSISLWQLYLSLDAPAASFGVDAYSTFVYPDWHRALRDTTESVPLLGAAPAGRLPCYVLVDYSRLDAGIGGPADHVIVLCGPDALANWEDLPPDAYAARKAAWTDALLADLERRFPGMRRAVRHAEMATARTMRRHLGTPGGAVYGFAQIPSAAGRFRPTPWTTVKGVYLASAFSRPGGGFTGAMLGGSSAYRAARKDGHLR
jgi:all-trans-retinol 13,14-reductase